MTDSTDKEYIESETFNFSQIIADRLAVVAPQSGLPQNITTADERQLMIEFLTEKDNEFLKELGLKRAETKGVHDVSFGTQPIGDFYFCDMLTDLFDLQPGKNILDFGCSSGRVIRNLAAAFDINAYGCDPRQDSIVFNKKHFPNVNWFVSNEAPPIAANDFEVPSFDMVFAISVWSHFSESRALEWFDEMSNIITSGGTLIFSTHGHRAIHHFSEIKLTMPKPKADERSSALRDGLYHYMPYPKGNDLDNEHWGMAFIPKHWFEKHLSSKWKITAFHPGMAMKNQDIYVLTRH